MFDDGSALTCDVSAELVTTDLGDAVRSLVYQQPATVTCRSGSLLEHGLTSRRLECSATSDVTDTCAGTYGFT